MYFLTLNLPSQLLALVSQGRLSCRRAHSYKMRTLQQIVPLMGSLLQVWFGRTELHIHSSYSQLTSQENHPTRESGYSCFATGCFFPWKRNIKSRLGGANYIYCLFPQREAFVKLMACKTEVAEVAAPVSRSYLRYLFPHPDYSLLNFHRSFGPWSAALRAGSLGIHRALLSLLSIFSQCTHGCFFATCSGLAQTWKPHPLGETFSSCVMNMSQANLKLHSAGDSWVCG